MNSTLKALILGLFISFNLSTVHAQNQVTFEGVKLPWSSFLYTLEPLIFYVSKPLITVGPQTYSPADLVAVPYKLYSTHTSNGGAWYETVQHGVHISHRLTTHEYLKATHQTLNEGDEITASTKVFGTSQFDGPMDLTEIQSQLTFPTFYYAPDWAELKGLESFQALKFVARIPYHALRGPGPVSYYSAKTLMYEPLPILEEASSSSVVSSTQRSHLEKIWGQFNDPELSPFYEAFFQSLYKIDFKFMNPEIIKTWQGRESDEVRNSSILNSQSILNSKSSHESWYSIFAGSLASLRPGSEKFAVLVRVLRSFTIENRASEIRALGINNDTLKRFESLKVDRETLQHIHEILNSKDFQAQNAISVIHAALFSEELQLNHETTTILKFMVEPSLHQVEDPLFKSSLIKLIRDKKIAKSLAPTKKKVGLHDLGEKTKAGWARLCRYLLK